MEAPINVAKLPHKPGVYMYKDAVGTVLYVGKAKDLASRVSQYFQSEGALEGKTKRMVAQIAAVETIETLSEFDALLLEAKLICEYQPKYNVVSRDDKSMLYVRLTLEEALPRVLFVRRPRHGVFFGPFQSGRVVRDLLRTLRRIVPYCTQKERRGRPCFYTHLNLCHPCPGAIVGLTDPAEKRRATRVYRANIFRLRDILSCNARLVLTRMKREMNSAARHEEFEKAAALRNQIQNLYRVLEKHYDPLLYTQTDQGAKDIFAIEEKELLQALAPSYPHLSRLTRIECIDVSNLGGRLATGSLVILSYGQPDTSQYRKFKIRSSQRPSDVAMIGEVMHRRLNHPEWPYPDIFVIDGGKGQVSMAQTVLEEKKIPIPVIGLAKRREEIIASKGSGFITIRLAWANPGLHLIERVRNEAHRFALTYHRLLHAKALRIV